MDLKITEIDETGFWATTIDGDGNTGSAFIMPDLPPEARVIDNVVAKIGEDISFLTEQEQKEAFQHAMFYGPDGNPWPT